MIAVASDHGGFEMKQKVKAWLKEMGEEVLDLGCDSLASVDYPVYGKRLAKAILEGKAQKGVLMCGTGIGMSITVNRFQGIRATLAHDAFTARMSREHNDSNVLVMGGRTTGDEVAKDMLKVWLNTPFEGGRHSNRLHIIDE